MYRENYSVVEKLFNWLEKVRNNEWKYNLVDEKWNLLSDE